MTPEEVQRIGILTAQMTTRCLGRYLVDMPTSFVLNSQHSTEIEGVTIQVTPMGKWDFEVLLESRRKYLETAKQRPEGFPHLRKITVLPDQAPGILIDRAKSDVSGGRLSRTLELLVWKEGFAINASTEATDTTFPEDANSKIVQEQLKTDTPEKLAQLLSVYERLRGRKDDEIPKEQGVCFANGFVKGPPTDTEILMIQHHLDKAPDVSSTFHSLSNLVQDDELLDRGKAIEAMLKETSGRTLRKGKALAQIPGAQEWLMSKKSNVSGLMWQHMTLEANAKTGSAATPVVIFDLDAGIEIPRPSPTLEEVATHKPLTQTTLSQAESIALWDKISATLRPRPGAF